MLTFQIEKTVSVSDFKSVLEKCSLGERRPLDDNERLAEMLQNANLIATARDNKKLIGIGRCVTDFVYCTYLSDLAVDEDYQKQGIGLELIKQIKLATPKAKLILISAPKSINYYPKIGMTRHEHCYFLDNTEDLSKP